MRIAAVQLDVDLAAPIEHRVAAAAGVVALHADADLIVLPELWATGAFLLDRFTADAQPLDGPWVESMASAARAASAWLHAGSFVERASDGRLFNTSVLFDDAGVVRATYRKVHLFGFRGGETTVLTGGESPVTCVTPFGVVGLSTCYDLRFPELYRALVDQGAQLVLVPGAWPERRIAHWEVLARARAIEDQVALVAVNTVGQQGPVMLGGRSLVVDAWGDLLAEAVPDAAEVLEVDVDLADVERVRTKFPVLPDRRL